MLEPVRLMYNSTEVKFLDSYISFSLIDNTGLMLFLLADIQWQEKAFKKGLEYLNHLEECNFKFESELKKQMQEIIKEYRQNAE